jgi:hypothetical protein
MLPDYIMDRQSPDKKLYVSGGSTKTLTLNQRHVFIAGASGPRSILNLPNVSEAEGLKFVLAAISMPATTGSGIDVIFSNGGISALSQSILTTSIELSLYSNGVGWTVNRTV